MCIVCVKPAGVSMPDQTSINNMWHNNPDGAGLMYAINNKVIIEKGFMALSDFNDCLSKLAKKYDLTKLPMVLHFRIGTAGGNIPENTHPFPITDSIGALKKLRIDAPIGVAHNGIIDVKPRQKDISDTMEYIASQLAPLRRAVNDFYKDKNLMLMIENAITSKMAFLTKEGDIYTIGSFQKEGGLLYSNSSYLYANQYRYLSGAWYSYEGLNNDDFYLAHKSVKAARMLMYLDDFDDSCDFVESSSYAIDENGEFFDGYDNIIAIDEHYGVYVYDIDADAFREIPNAHVFDAIGNHINFDINMASSCEVLLAKQDG